MKRRPAGHCLSGPRPRAREDPTLSAPEPITPLPSRTPVARLRLVEGTPACQHTWRLHGVDFTDGASVREFGCSSCGSVWFD